MATFAQTSFKSINYNSFRPQYPQSFYKLLLDYAGKTKVQNTIDLGCGTGVATFPLLNFSQNVIGLDLSPKMIECANELKLARLRELGVADESRISFEVSAVEDFSAPPESFDLITAAECIHWFKDYDTFFDAAHKQLRPGGTLAYWYYVDPLIVGFDGTCDSKLLKDDATSRAMELYHTLVYKDADFLGPHWEQPGRSILQGALVEVDRHIPSDKFTDVKIKKFVPEKGLPYADDDLQLCRNDITLRDYTKYLSTFSSFHNYQEATGKGQELLNKFLNVCENELGWDGDTTTLHLQWSAGYTFMKKK